MATENQKKFTIVCTEDEAKFIQETADLQELSVNQFLKNIIFPGAYSNSVDKAVYKAIRECEPISKSVSMRMSLQRHAEIAFRKSVYVWYERYNYIFVRDEKSEILFPMCHNVINRTPLESIMLCIMNRNTYGFVYTDHEFSQFSRVLKIAEHYDYEDRYIVENSVTLQKVIGGYKMVTE